MKIKTILNQHRRDFIAIFECEHCGDTKTYEGYDDEYFHAEVIPKIPCQECGEVAPDSYRPLKTKYPDGMVI